MTRFISLAHRTYTIGILVMAVCTITITTACHNIKSRQASSAEADLIEIPKKADGSVDYDKLPTIAFTDTKFDFGHIPRNVKVRHAFIFTNSGHVPLIISNVTSGCGCTVPTWPRYPIAPGVTDSILVQYNSQGVSGAFNKGVSVISNTYPNESILAIKGYVGQSHM